MAKQEIESFTVNDVGVRLIKTKPAEYGERSRWTIEINGVERGYMFFPTGRKSHWLAYPLSGKPKSILDVVQGGFSGEAKARRESTAKRVVEAIAAGKAFPSQDELVAQAAEAERAAEKADADNKAQRRNHVDKAVEALTGMEAIRDKFRGQMSNMEISLFEDAIKLMRSGSPYEAVKEIDQRKRDAGEH
jgi:hypothetical protein